VDEEIDSQGQLSTGRDQPAEPPRWSARMKEQSRAIAADRRLMMQVSKLCAASPRWPPWSRASPG
jgi:selenophosphate synthetase-related protein